MGIRSGDGLNTILGGMRLNPLTVVSESDSLMAVASSLLNHRVSCAVLDEPPLRVVTEHDLSAAWAQGHDAEDEVSKIATTHPRWAPVSASISDAAALMVSLGIRHLVVLDVTGRPTGIVSMSEIFSVLVQAQDPTSLYAVFTDVMLRRTTN
jgi:signal-transduction protein with cAMP-binding, CBS, and nucleotidyltransferase domain